MMKVPELEDKVLQQFLTELLMELDKQNKVVLSKVTANHSLLLLSPGLKTFEVKVSDTGVLSTSAPALSNRRIG
jgi:hypothetical protein